MFSSGLLSDPPPPYHPWSPCTTVSASRDRRSRGRGLDSALKTVTDPPFQGKTTHFAEMSSLCKSTAGVRLFQA